MVLRLYGARVDAVMVQHFSDIHRDGHKLVLGGCQDVDRSDDLAFRKLPDVQLVERQDAFDPQYRRPNPLNRNGRRGSLQKNERRAPHCMKTANNKYGINDNGDENN